MFEYLADNKKILFKTVGQLRLFAAVHTPHSTFFPIESIQIKVFGNEFYERGLDPFMTRYTELFPDRTVLWDWAYRIDENDVRQMNASNSNLFFIILNPKQTADIEPLKALTKAKAIIIRLDS